MSVFVFAKHIICSFQIQVFMRSYIPSAMINIPHTKLQILHLIIYWAEDTDTEIVIASNLDAVSQFPIMLVNFP